MSRLPADGSSPAEIQRRIDRLFDQGLDPSKVISCVPSAGTPGAVPGVRGCPVYDRCPFDRTKFGGFKGDRPHNIGYYIKTNDGTNHQKEDITSCFRFVMHWWERMRSGIRDREDGKNGEIIDIVAQEGGLVRIKTFNPERESGGQWEPGDIPIKAVRRTAVVPVYEYPDEASGDSHEAELERAMMERRQSDPDFKVGAKKSAEEVSAEAQSARAAFLAEADDSETLDLDATVTETAPVGAKAHAAPVKK